MGERQPRVGLLLYVSLYWCNYVLTVIGNCLYQYDVNTSRQAKSGAPFARVGGAVQQNRITAGRAANTAVYDVQT